MYRSTKRVFDKGGRIAQNEEYQPSMKKGKPMPTYSMTYTEQIKQEIEQTPDEYLPLLLEMVHLFRQSVTLKPAEESFQQGWQEALSGETMPISELWNGIDS